MMRKSGAGCGVSGGDRSAPVVLFNDSCVTSYTTKNNTTAVFKKLQAKEDVTFNLAYIDGDGPSKGSTKAGEMDFLEFIKTLGFYRDL